MTLVSHSVLHQGTDIPGVYNVVFNFHVLLFSHITFQINEHTGTFHSRLFESVSVVEFFIALSYDVH